MGCQSQSDTNIEGGLVGSVEYGGDIRLLFCAPNLGQAGQEYANFTSRQIPHTHMTHKHSVECRNDDR